MHLGAADDAELLEVAPRGRQRVERVGLLPELADGDAHGLKFVAVFTFSAVQCSVFSLGNGAIEPRSRASSTSARVMAAQKP